MKLAEQIEQVWDWYEAEQVLREIRQQHPPIYDSLDDLFDCGHPDCPKCGFDNEESADAHYFIWRLK